MAVKHGEPGLDIADGRDLFDAGAGFERVAVEENVAGDGARLAAGGSGKAEVRLAIQSNGASQKGSCTSGEVAERRMPCV